MATEAALLLVDWLIEAVPIEFLPPADAIFIFGHIDPRLAEHAADLYLAGKAPVVIIAGGVGTRTVLPAPYQTEAAFYRDIMVRRGVPIWAIILEDKSANTLENALWGIPLAMQTVRELSQVIVVAMPPLLRRSLATMRQHFPDLAVVGSAFSSPDEEWVSDRWLGRLKGEIERLREYADKGDILRVVIPDAIMEAYRSL